MRFQDFRDKVAKYPYFRSQMLSFLVENPQILQNQLVTWRKKGLITELKRSVYCFNEQPTSISAFALAQVLYSPSYISLESALSYYQMIPEQVIRVTSISSKKTQRFQNSMGDFQYRHIKQSCFQGYVEKKDEFGQSFLIALPEKALVDYCYFQLRSLKKPIDQDWFDLSLRLQNMAQCDLEKVRFFAELFNYQKLMRAVAFLEEQYA